VVDRPRREGDPVELVAKNGRLVARFGWAPRHDDLDFIVRTALAWERRNAGAEAPALS
jgi:UDP-glucose 4-epimerase